MKKRFLIFALLFICSCNRRSKYEEIKDIIDSLFRLKNIVIDSTQKSYFSDSICKSYFLYDSMSMSEVRPPLDSSVFSHSFHKILYVIKYYPNNSISSISKFTIKVIAMEESSTKEIMEKEVVRSDTTLNYYFDINHNIIDEEKYLKYCDSLGRKKPN